MGSSVSCAGDMEMELALAVMHGHYIYWVPSPSSLFQVVPAGNPAMIMHTCGIAIISLPEYYCMISSKHRFLRNIASPVFFL
jgi:hypothetical protein